LLAPYSTPRGPYRRGHRAARAHAGRGRDAAARWFEDDTPVIQRQSGDPGDPYGRPRAPHEHGASTYLAMGCERVDGARQPKQQQPEPACVHSAIAPSGRFRKFPEIRAAMRATRRRRRRRHAPKRAWALRSPRGGAASWRGRAPRDRCRVASVSARTTAGASSAYVAWTAVASIRHVTAVALAAE
jgi:hypothetical protein